VHVLGEAFKRDAKVNMEHIAFKGAAPLKQEMLAGRIQVGGDQLSSSLAEIKGGSLKALATTASSRIGVLPDVPTVRELGFANLELEGWNGIFVPAKTPKEIDRAPAPRSGRGREAPGRGEAAGGAGRGAGGIHARRAGRDPAPADGPVPPGDPGHEAGVTASSPRERG
jgi:hypothetical protein